jgi:hypothetical protein
MESTSANCSSGRYARGCLEAARALQKEGRVRFVGFSTHATTDIILEAVESWEFDYVKTDSLAMALIPPLWICRGPVLPRVCTPCGEERRYCFRWS